MNPRFLVVTPSRRCDPSLAAAAVRAGEIGLLDLGLAVPSQVRASALRDLIRSVGARDTWGCRWQVLGRADRQVGAALGEIDAPLLPNLLLAGLPADTLDDPTALRRFLHAARAVARRVLVEVTDLAAAHAVASVGCDGIILRTEEAGGLVGPHPAFLLLQQCREGLPVPFWLAGGWGPDSAAAACLAGAAGVVLGEELWLARESPWSPDERARLGGLDGSETYIVERDGHRQRLFFPGGREQLAALERAVEDGAAWPDHLHEVWSSAQDDGAPLGGNDPVPLGQGIAFAAGLARRYVTTGGVLSAFRDGSAHNVRLATAQRALTSESPLAADNGTRYPILQGPMTRVSDTTSFCEAVADGGGLPFLALALMRGPAVEKLLKETAGRMGPRPWGVGILGFVPPELRQEQLAAVAAHPPRFALIAGGRPGQARELESQGIPTYLHVPSPQLLEVFLEQGARRFIFEGRECGGHVGPRSSFTLWQSIVDTLLAAKLDRPQDIHVVFAGGIHDGFSAALVAVLAARLVERGVRVGVLMGTAYLFTHEAVSCGAITSEYQAQAIACRQTTLLASGVGHATRSATTPFADQFVRRRQELQREERSPDDIRFELEMLNLGRLRVASKGLRREAGQRVATRGQDLETAPAPDDTGGAAAAGADRLVERGAQMLGGKLRPVSVATQRRDGLYMIGAVATLRDATMALATLHDNVASGGVAELERRAASRQQAGAAVEAGPGGEAIAIVGMACRFAESPDLGSFWRNILQGFDAVREVPEERWLPALYYSADRLDKDHTYSKWGSFLEPARFDPIGHGIPPASVAHIEPTQLLTLDVCTAALADAGYTDRPFPRDRTATIFASGGVSDVGINYAMRTMLPQHLQHVTGVSDEAKRRIVAGVRERLPGWSEDSFPGFLLNVLSGRVANRLDLKGSNFVVDAACAASLAAVQTAVEQLRAGMCDMALVGAADGTNNAFTFMSFARTHALTPSGRLRAFDDAADGIVLGEGIAAVVLKRLTDAERDGDRIHAVIRGVGSSSDGRNRSLTAPHPASQALAIERAYADAGIAPGTVALVEAHATGTAVGDRSEIEAMKHVFGEQGRGKNNDEPFCAIGSVKSMIGHTKTVAGLAGLIKTTLALSHRILPPTINVKTPNRAAGFDGSPFYVNTETRPWVHVDSDAPRRAGVSAFGFGGTNFHVVMEEYDADSNVHRHADLTPRSVEIFLWARENVGALERDVAAFEADLGVATETPLAQLAASHARAERRRRGASAVRLGVVASSVDDLRDKLRKSREAGGTVNGHPPGLDSDGVYFSSAAPASSASVCFLFPGQGSQRVNMLRDLACSGPFGTQLLEEADRLLAGRLPQTLASAVYPAPVFSSAARKAQQAALDDTRMAQPALGVMNLFATDVLGRFGLTPAFTAGHSYGEYVALSVAGLNDREHLLTLSAQRGQAVYEAALATPGGMVAVAADEATTRAAIEEMELEVEIANLNAPRQTIVAGSVQAIDAAIEAFPGGGIAVRRIAVTAPFHTSAMEGPSRAIAGYLRAIPMRPPRLPVYSNVTAAPYPADIDAVREQLALHLARPVRFVEQIEALHRAGATIFVEAGPGRILTGLVTRILSGKPHHALPLDAPGQPGWTPLGHLLARAHVLGLPVQARPWFEGRDLRDVSVAVAIEQARTEAAGRPTDWLLSPGGSRRATEAPPLAEDRRGGVSSSIMQPANKQMAGGEPDLPDEPHTERPAAGHVRPETLDRLQQSMEQWLELQREQQRLSERFLALQERVAAGLFGQDVPAQRLAVATEPTVTQGVVAQPGTGLGVAPAPVLPDLSSFGTADGLAPKTVDAPAARAPIAVATLTAPAPTAGVATRPADETGPSTRTVMPDDLPTVATFQSDLIAEVAARTGYPVEMLELDVPLEAGLGIDSIKTMEIFSALKPYHAILADEGQDDEDILVRFTQMKTLRDIVTDFAARRDEAAQTLVATRGRRDGTSAAPAFDGAVAPVGGNGTNGHAPVRRLVPRSVAAPATNGDRPIGEGLAFPAGDILLVLGEAPEIGSSLEAALSAGGIPAFQIVPGKKTRQVGAHRFEANLASATDVRRLAGEIRAAGGGRVGGLVNLLTLSATMRKTGLNGLQAPLRLVRWLTRVAQVFEEDIRASCKDGGGWLLNVTSMDGRFGLRGGRSLPIAQAGSLGFFKSLAREWRGVRVKNVDLDPDADPRALVVGLLQELASGDDTLEVGIDGQGRWRLELEDVPLSPPNGHDAEPSGSGLATDGTAVILATGGARGITAEVLKGLARRTRARLVIVGQSEPTDEEPAAWRGLETTVALRAQLLAEMRAADRNVTPAAVEACLKDALRDRAIRANLQALRAAGSAVEYHALDVRDAKRFGALIEATYERHDRIDGVIHGAGRIEDRWVRDKTLESLARVFETKVTGALVLARHLRPANLRFLVFFGSVSGRFGNAGQTDYSAANECLNKLADHLDGEWPGRVVSVNWGPWDAGMIPDGLRTAYKQRGIELISVETGVQSLLDELSQRHASPAEVILACTPERLAAPLEPDR